MPYIQQTAVRSTQYCSSSSLPVERCWITEAGRNPKPHNIYMQPKPNNTHTNTCLPQERGGERVRE